MSEDTPMLEIMEQMKSGQGFFVYNDVEVMSRRGRPIHTDCKGNKYKTYALNGIDLNGDEITENHLISQFCQMILGKVYSISCTKPEGENTTLRPVSIVWRMNPQIIEADSEKIIIARCAFYVHNIPFDDGIWVD